MQSASILKPIFEFWTSITTMHIPKYISSLDHLIIDMPFRKMLFCDMIHRASPPILQNTTYLIITNNQILLIECIFFIKYTVHTKKVHKYFTSMMTPFSAILSPGSLEDGDFAGVV